MLEGVSSWQARNTFCEKFIQRPLEKKILLSLGNLLLFHLLTRKIKIFHNSPVCNMTAFTAFQDASWNNELTHTPTSKSNQTSILPHQRRTSGDVVSLPIRDKFRVFKGKILPKVFFCMKLLSEVPKLVSDISWGQFACPQKLTWGTMPRWHTLQMSIEWLIYSSKFATGKGCWIQPTEAFALSWEQVAAPLSPANGI